jgi:hypothetical protein
VSWKKREANTGFMEWGALEVGQDVSGKLNAGVKGRGHLESWSGEQCGHTAGV